MIGHFYVRETSSNVILFLLFKTWIIPNDGFALFGCEIFLLVDGVGRGQLITENTTIYHYS